MHFCLVGIYLFRLFKKIAQALTLKIIINLMPCGPSGLRFRIIYVPLSSYIFHTHMCAGLHHLLQFKWMIYFCLISYRAREEIKEMRETRDPITVFRRKILECSLVTPEELKVGYFPWGQYTVELLYFRLNVYLHSNSSKSTYRITENDTFHQTSTDKKGFISKFISEGIQISMHILQREFHI